ncbi:hypothetical protein BXY41_11672 [Lacrimispora xylanisolvens]|uniref:Phage abortive infection protein n=1 Tax=Lacrimispora xylanisolvens TaxID=384636 RepID=A0A2S6HJG8_9FIRM|nr:hypothetical protein [Hungatella xylanolytica]PPK77533.1 hypothetical protein BXY41_11672 [Hungatella xylanolytica]
MKKHLLPILIVIAISAIFPICIDKLVLGSNYPSNVNNEVWMSFLGGYLGAIIGAIITLIVMYISINNSNKQLDKTLLAEKEKEIKNIKREFCGYIIKEYAIYNSNMTKAFNSAVSYINTSGVSEYHFMVNSFIACESVYIELVLQLQVNSQYAEIDKLIKDLQIINKRYDVFKTIMIDIDTLKKLKEKDFIKWFENENLAILNDVMNLRKMVKQFVKTNLKQDY